MRDELKQHIGVSASLMGREGPDQVRVSGLTLLPEPGKFTGSLSILLFLSGNVKVEFVRDWEDPNSLLGARVGFTDIEDSKSINLTFAPRRLHVTYLEKLNRARHALNQLVTTPTEKIRKQFTIAVDELEKPCEDEGHNDWLPWPFWEPGSDKFACDSERQPGEISGVKLIWDSVGPFQLMQCDELSLENQEWLTNCANEQYGALGEPLEYHQDGNSTRVDPPPWLSTLSGVALMDLQQDLQFLGEKYEIWISTCWCTCDGYHENGKRLFTLGT